MKLNGLNELQKSMKLNEKGEKYVSPKYGKNFSFYSHHKDKITLKKNYFRTYFLILLFRKIIL